MDFTTIITLILFFQVLTFTLTLIVGCIIISKRSGMSTKPNKLAETKSDEKKGVEFNPYVFLPTTKVSKQVLHHQRIILECKITSKVEDVGTFNESIISSTNAACKLLFGELETKFVGFVPLGEVNPEKFFIILEIKRSANPADVVSEFVARKAEEYSVVTIKKFEEGEDLSWLYNMLSS